MIPRKLNSTLLLLFIIFFGCTGKDDEDNVNNVEEEESVAEQIVDTSNFIEGHVVINTVEKTLTNGEVVDCYEFVLSEEISIPADHNMGPWCPTNIDELGDDVGGIWLSDDFLYQVDGEFLENLATFYDDNSWQIYDEDTGDIYVTDTRDDCIAAAALEVSEEYYNYCVYCLPEWVKASRTYYIPITPVKAEEVDYDISTRGLAINGVIFDEPAPIEDILSFYTIAPLDNAGGHLNEHDSYHYHTSTGMSREVEQADGHTGMIGYAFDGFGMFAQTTDEDENELDVDLDECRGHEDDTRGYHYHVSAPGVNEFIPCFAGAYVVD